MLRVNNGGITIEERRKNSFDRLVSDSDRDGRVLLIYTGGTIGMVRNENGVLVPKSNILVEKLRNYSDMHDREYAEERFGATGPLVLPITTTKSRRVVYSVLEYPSLCDSSNMTMDDWIRIANDIKESYEYFDGFVVLHGTDTLSYTASALSFMFEALDKTIILTGSQLPIFDTRSDGLYNIISSLVIAGNYNIPEVCVFFGTKLMRGNRTCKVSATSFDAFDSPNIPPLAKVNIDIEVNYRAIFRSCTLEKFRLHASLNRNVVVLRIFPSITTNLVKAFVQPPTEGVVLQCYGTGNLPSNLSDIVQELCNATKRGIIIVNITQCLTGCVSETYESAKQLREAGVISGFDMTSEAALAKLAYVLSKKEWDMETKRLMIETNLRGELTAGRSSSLKDFDPVEGIARSLRISSTVEFEQLRMILFPAIFNAAVLARDLPKLDALTRYGADISQTNADGRTALHIACCEGDSNVVRRLLNMGANVRIKDRYNRTPLTDAIEYDHHEIIKMLLKYGAHLHENAYLIGEKMCAAAAVGNVKRLKSFHFANGNLSEKDLSGRTPLHLAALHNKVQTIKFLLDHNVETNSCDKMAMTPYDVAKTAGSAQAESLLLSTKTSNLLSTVQ
ncbi:L-asparaginase isoform X1 [Colletes latitarsis]|uniref:L-asparaginase isoform X1 n=1 Tax=Colletes latitarsis TaxID=2605962 RepID=UPI0040373F2F